MSSGVHQILVAIDRLTESEKHEIAVEVLRRHLAVDSDLPDEALVAAADEQFQILDAEEIENAAR